MEGLKPPDDDSEIINFIHLSKHSSCYKFSLFFLNDYFTNINLYASFRKSILVFSSYFTTAKPKNTLRSLRLCVKLFWISIKEMSLSSEFFTQRRRERRKKPKI